jgi:uncharacterized repeat protein (TIGR03803 family)
VLRATRFWPRWPALCAAAVLCATPASPGSVTFTVLHTFAGGGADGGGPRAGLLEDNVGNLYGTTEGGGDTCTHYYTYNCGTVFKVAPDGAETLLYVFTGTYKNRGGDGAFPIGGLIADGSGDLYGTTYEGGDGDCRQHTHHQGCGTVFRLAPGGAESVLHAFAGGRDGAFPAGSLLMDANGDLYGTTAGEGIGCDHDGCGTVFELTPNGMEIVLYVFRGGEDGAFPAGNLIADSAGNLYGTTASGGGSGCSGDGCGTVFRLAPDGREHIVYRFKGGNDGYAPFGGLIIDGAGNLYGTTAYGGGTTCIYGYGCGVVFKVTPDGHEKVIYAFQGGGDGVTPYPGLTADAAGNLYGTTEYGGGGACTDGCGTVFELVKGKTERVLYAFTGGSNGFNPYGGVILQGGAVNACGGSGCGIVFKLTR